MTVFCIQHIKNKYIRNSAINIPDSFDNYVACASSRNKDVYDVDLYWPTPAHNAVCLICFADKNIKWSVILQYGHQANKDCIKKWIVRIKLPNATCP